MREADGGFVRKQVGPQVLDPVLLHDAGHAVDAGASDLASEHAPFEALVAEMESVARGRHYFNPAEALEG